MIGIYYFFQPSYEEIKDDIEGKILDPGPLHHVPESRFEVKGIFWIQEVYCDFEVVIR